MPYFLLPIRPYAPPPPRDVLFGQIVQRLFVPEEVATAGEAPPSPPLPPPSPTQAWSAPALPAQHVSRSGNGCVVTADTASLSILPFTSHARAARRSFARAVSASSEPCDHLWGLAGFVALVAQPAQRAAIQACVESAQGGSRGVEAPGWVRACRSSDIVPFQDSRQKNGWESCCPGDAACVLSPSLTP